MPTFWHFLSTTLLFRAQGNASPVLAKKINRIYPISLLLTMSIMLSACAIEFPLIKGPTLPLSAVLDEPTDADMTQFVDTLTVALTERDYPQLQQMMANPFQTIWWHANDVKQPAAVALLAMRDTYLGAGSAIAFPQASHLAEALDGAFALPRGQGNIDIVHALYVSGLGLGQEGEAFIFIARDVGNTPYWHSIVLADQGFPIDATTASTSTAHGTALINEPNTALATTDLSQSSHSSINDVHVEETRSIADHFLLPLQNTTGDAISGVSTLPRVHFADDDIDATVRGVIQPVQERTYLLKPYSTQALHFALNSTMPVANFTIIGIDDGQSYKEVADKSPLWQGLLPPTQEYVVTITSTVAQPFELTISSIATDTTVAMAETMPVDNTADNMAASTESATTTPGGVASADTP